MKVLGQFHMVGEAGDAEKMMAHSYWMLPLPVLFVVVPHPYGAALLAASCIYAILLTLGTAFWIRSERERVDGIERANATLVAMQEGIAVDILRRIAFKLDDLHHSAAANELRFEVEQLERMRGCVPPHGQCDCGPPP